MMLNNRLLSLIRWLKRLKRVLLMLSVVPFLVINDAKIQMQRSFAKFSSSSSSKSAHEARQRLQPPVVGMVPSLRLYLIRHGETVDNVAGL